jgi:hypothetical protein
VDKKILTTDKSKTLSVVRKLRLPVETPALPVCGVIRGNILFFTAYSIITEKQVYVNPP